MNRRTFLQLQSAFLASTSFNALHCEATDSAFYQMEVGSDGDLLAFDPTELECPANTKIQLRFTNHAKYIHIEHNWVLVNKGTWEQVDAAGLAAGPENDWVPVNHPDVLAYTPLVKNGESVIMEFISPAAGDYTYICTFPGHAAVMYGFLKVT